MSVAGVRERTVDLYAKLKTNIIDGQTGGLEIYRCPEVHTNFSQHTHAPPRACDRRTRDKKEQPGGGRIQTAVLDSQPNPRLSPRTCRRSISLAALSSSAWKSSASS